MSYSRGYERKNWRAHHLRKRQELSREFAGIDEEILSLFFSISPDELDSLLIRYGEAYGQKAEAYARQAYPRWRSGATMLSEQTATRLLNLIPPSLSPHTRSELVKKLRHAYLSKQTRHIVTSASTWVTDIKPAIKSVVSASRNFSLPTSLQEKATWLMDGDTATANKIFASAEIEEAKMFATYLRAELDRIETVIKNTPHVESIAHTVTLPQGVIHIVIESEKKTILEQIKKGFGMKENFSNIVNLPSSRDDHRHQDSLLDTAVADLDDRKKAEFAQRVLDEKLALDVARATADQRFTNSTKDINNVLNMLKVLDQDRSNAVDVTATIATSSGETKLRVKRDNNIVIIVVAIVIGIIIIAAMK